MHDDDRDDYLCDQSNRGPASIRLGGGASAGSLDEISTCAVKLIWREEWKGGQAGARHRTIIKFTRRPIELHFGASDGAPSTADETDASGLRGTAQQRGVMWGDEWSECLCLMELQYRATVRSTGMLVERGFGFAD